MPGANPHLEHLIVQKMRFPVPGPTHRLEFAVGEFVKVTVAPSVLATISGLIGSKPPQRHVLINVAPLSSVVRHISHTNIIVTLLKLIHEWRMP